ncbi:unnamed protein product [Ceutorhynchus assimilis]|uniref:Ribosomal RNA-processing protein 4 n=1 Tax=Ceutorhynchus assimilis TaxID=467358 RepID=A0A9P0DIK4_9CUCU|nr:unnamed protein product [Ceutorhynchus assimilis]
MNSDSDNSISEKEVPEKSSANLKLTEILEKYHIIFKKSQVPKIKEKKKKHTKKFIKKYIVQIVKNISEQQLKRKIQNMKTEVKKKTDISATGNKNIILNLWERQLLTLVEGKEKPSFSKDTRGHGTYEEDGDLKASVAGVKEQVNKLISVRPLKSRYDGQVGEVLVGRIMEVQQKRWKVDTNARLDSALLISSVNLPGGELRKRSLQDQHSMRQYLQEGDLISAEVQSIFVDGTLSLHTRSLRYGKLAQGILVKVFPSLIKKTKLHYHNLPFGVGIILGNNGYVWISPPVSTTELEGNEGGFVQNLEEVIPRDIREAMARVRNCILALAQSYMMLFNTSVVVAYEESLKYAVHELLLPEVMIDVALLTQQRMNMMEDYEF